MEKRTIKLSAMKQEISQHKIKQLLIEKADAKYQKFSASLLPNINNVLGVRLPILRKIAKDLYRFGNWTDFLNKTNNEYMEEIMLKGMIIGLINEPVDKILQCVKNFIPQITNWAICDSFCSGLKFTSKNKDIVWEFIQPYLKSNKEYEIRFGVVMILNYFIENEYIDRILQILDNINHEGYYAKMGVAWAISICFVKQEQKTLNYMKSSNLDKWTYNKAIQKCIESYRITNETKEKLKKMKK